MVIVYDCKTFLTAKVIQLCLCIIAKWSHYFFFIKFKGFTKTQALKIFGSLELLTGLFQSCACSPLMAMTGFLSISCLRCVSSLQWLLPPDKGLSGPYRYRRALINLNKAPWCARVGLLVVGVIAFLRVKGSWRAASDEYACIDRASSGHERINHKGALQNLISRFIPEGIFDSVGETGYRSHFCRESRARLDRPHTVTL